MQDGWANTVVAGRARLGGIPVGVVAVETRTVEALSLADPANQDTEARVIQQAGQVWFPDSAFKTAQAIRDFNNEQLPLIIFANWRGFSGGMRDMFEEVLKYGAYIVDALREFKQPVMIYIPPFGELRGGAWVVVDPSINSDMMEMYADADSRGGVLEPEGTVEIKFRKPEQLKVMRRNDAVYDELCQAHEAAVEKRRKDEEEAAHAQSTPPPSPLATPSPGSPLLSSRAKQQALSAQADQIKAMEQRMRQREKDLLPIYHQVAVQFADLHDTAGRMKSKGCISDILEWRTSREYLYWRLRRRLAELDAGRDIMAASPDTKHADVCGWGVVYTIWSFSCLLTMVMVVRRPRPCCADGCRLGG